MYVLNLVWIWIVCVFFNPVISACTCVCDSRQHLFENGNLYWLQVAILLKNTDHLSQIISINKILEVALTLQPIAYGWVYPISLKPKPESVN